MRRIVASGIVALAAVAGCAGAGGSIEPEAAESEPTTFTLPLARGTTAENVIPQIVAAARADLAPLCEEHPGALVRVVNPLASGAYADVPCSAILAGEQATGQATSPLTNEVDGPLGEAQQELGPISFLMCGLFAGGTALFTRYALCPHGRTESDRTKCNDVGLWGGIGIGVLCSIPF